MLKFIQNNTFTSSQIERQILRQNYKKSQIQHITIDYAQFINREWTSNARADSNKEHKIRATNLQTKVKSPIQKYASPTEKKNLSLFHNVTAI
jgi:hypothetical protein